jgi:hypothetical protein
MSIPVRGSASSPRPRLPTPCEKLNAEINALMKEPDSLEKIAKAGFDPVVKSVAEANDYYKSEVESWGKMVKASLSIEFPNLTRHASSIRMTNSDHCHERRAENLRHLSDLEGPGSRRRTSAPRWKRVAAQYAVAITPAMAELIDRADPNDPIARQFVPDRGRACRHRRSAPIRSATYAHSPVDGIVHRYPDRVLLKLTHVCAVYCRFCFRREMVGPPPSRLTPHSSIARSAISPRIRRSGRSC